jgi:hypothetical protein
MRVWSGRARVLCGVLAAGVVATSISSSIGAHGTEARFVQLLQWKRDRIARTFGTGGAYYSAFGMTGTRVEHNALEMRILEGRMCVIGGVIASTSTTTMDSTSTRT